MKYSTLYLKTSFMLCGAAVVLLCGAHESASHAVDAQSGATTFAKDALVKAPQIVDCTLTDGTAAQCTQLVVKYKPDNLNVGPFCPETLNDKGGIWDWDGKNAGLYRLDGSFWKMLDAQGYKFHENDKVNITTNLDGKPKAANTCMSMAAQEQVEITMLIPVHPKMAAKPTDLGTVAKVGVALDGVPIFADAPSVLKTGHLPALDTCGGHIDPGGWYHWHATATDINGIFDKNKVDAKCGLPQSSSAQFGYAFDGYAMYGTTDANGQTPKDLDACNGHISATPPNKQGEYHYHATNRFPNLPACLKGVQAKDNFSTTSASGIGSKNTHAGAVGSEGGGAGQRPDFAKKLGVSESVLMQALEKAGGPQANLSDVAKAIGVTEDALKATLPKRPE
jgi:hypothetical protein